MDIANLDTKFNQMDTIDLSIHKSPITRDSFSDYIKTTNQDGTHSLEEPSISIIIVAYNEDQCLIDLLSSLHRQNKTNEEILLVDNGLSKSTINQLDLDKLTYIKTTTNTGCCGGRNIGASLAKGKRILFLDADGKIEEDLIKNTLKLSSEAFVALRGKVLPKDGNVTPSHYNLGDNPIPSITNTEGISIWDKSLYNKAGGFETNLYGHEGLVLNYRMYELFGVTPENFIYDPSLVLYHNYNDDESHLLKKLSARESANKSIKLFYPLLPYFKDFYTSYLPKPDKKAREFNQRNKKLARKLKSSEKHTNSAKNSSEFSVVIPCYNLGSLIDKAINSVKSQTMPPTKIIIVDDCSTDNDTIKHITKLKKSKDLQVIVHSKNQGVAAARNTGIAACDTKYILCLDADDTIEPNYLEKATNVFDLNDNIGLVGSWVNFFGERNGSWRPKDKTQLKDSLTTSPLPTATCFKKDAWEKTPEGYNKNLRGYEDWDYWLSVLEAGYEARVIPEYLFNYFTRPNSKVKTSNKNAYDLVTGIVENHLATYTSNCSHVIATQREQLNKTSLRLQKAERKVEKLNKKRNKSLSQKTKRALKSIISSFK